MVLVTGDTTNPVEAAEEVDQAFTHIIDQLGSDIDGLKLDDTSFSFTGKVICVCLCIEKC